MSRAKPELTVGDHVFLAFLTYGPMSAYDIKKTMAVSVSFFWAAAHSQVYQQAARLVRDGYVREREADGARRKKVLSLTAKGRAAVNRWLRSAAGMPALYDESLAKLFFASRGDRAKTREMLEDQLEQHTHRLQEFEGIRAALEQANEPDPGYELMTLQLGLRVERAWVDWLEESIAKLD
jgi:DNA-binding PadR family transcriptional regulator